jgi:(1->4)-alpha-D-glucan 1-alpha-D-glucosylmutase
MPPDIPLATYRVQLTKEFGFDESAALVPYLKALGITHLYASPFLKARPGSTHGYDIVDHNALNPELGGEAAFERLDAALKQADLGLILDFVPNHMAVGSEGNVWWHDVLEWGQKSPHAASFDIAWELLPYRHGGGVLLPVLGRPYGDALTGGELILKYDPNGSLSVWYFDHRFPINPQRYHDIIHTAVAAADAGSTAAAGALLALARDHSRPGTPSYRQAPAFKAELAAIDGGAEIIQRGISAYRADHEAGVNLLHRLLERQHYRLADWRLAPSGINYRRFFDINELAGLRVEDARTFRDIHGLVARLIAGGRLQGLRLDHIDGLFDPQQYARRLQQLTRRLRGRAGPFYVVVEKILGPGERLPPLAGVAGTTGYEWLNLLSRLLVNEDGRQALGALWRRIAPERADFDQVLEDSKLRVLGTIMASEFNVLSQLLGRIAAGHFSTRDYGPDRLREALRLYVLEFPIYRTYVTAAACNDDDRAVIERAIAAARRRWQGSDADIFDFLRDAITLDLTRSGQPYSRTRLRQFALKLQQFTGPMMAKSLEDTALYRYCVLIALNEVGGHPTLPGVTVQQFHDAMARRAIAAPHGLTATATHDTKRGEDARMRILALSEMPSRWAEHVARWQELNAPLVSVSGSTRSPSAAHEYMLYQTLVGCWPCQSSDETLPERIEGYAIKAAREGKLETSWINPDESYERGLREFVRTILDRAQSRLFLDSLAEFAQRTALIGALNSLSQLALKATMPGVPDFYQGTECWDLSLVDPDNRRPVDFTARRRLLGETVDWRDLAGRWADGAIKLALTHRLLELRRRHAPLFQNGSYEPVEVSGAGHEHAVAFLRAWRRDKILVVVGRHFAVATDMGREWPRFEWQGRLEPDGRDGGWHDALGSCEPGHSLGLSQLLKLMPVAVLRNS